MAASSSSSWPEASLDAVASAAVHLEGRLRIAAEQLSDRGRRDANDDCLGLRLPGEPVRTLKGVAAAIADGVSSAEAGREAAETCVQSFLADYYSTPDSWSVKHSVQVVLTALNRWLYAKSHGTHAAHRGYVSTFSAVVIKSRTAHLFHVGDSRIHRFRDGRLERLTTDHATQISERERYLSRAMGMDSQLDVDYRAVDVRAGDLLLLTTDGLHDWLPETEIAAALARGADAEGAFEKTCAELVAAALRGGSDDNLSVQLIRVDAVEPPERDEVVRELTRLPFPPPLEPGMRIDGYRVEREIHASARSQIYLVTDEASGERLAMKTPSVNFEDDPAYIERFVMEPWIGSRVEHPNVVRIAPTPASPSCLYYLMEYVDGPTFDRWRAAQESVSIAEVIQLVEQVARGLTAFERREMLHQDLKPQNLMIGGFGRVRIVDFGSCWVAGIREIEAPIERDLALGTASYSAPETRSGRGAGMRSEIFSLGCIAYELLTGKLPYGEAIERCSGPRDFQRLSYTPAYHHQPMIPLWIDGALRKAVAIAPGRRYAALSELVYDLRHPNPVFLREGPRPLVERDPLRFWQGVAAALAAAWALTLWLGWG